MVVDIATPVRVECDQDSPSLGGYPRHPFVRVGCDRGLVPSEVVGVTVACSVGKRFRWTALTYLMRCPPMTIMRGT